MSDGSPTTTSGSPTTPPLGRRIGLVAGLLLFLATRVLPPPVGLEAAGWAAAGVAALMAVWWMLEVVPIPATSLLPLALFPLLGVASVTDSARPYANPIIFLFMGGFMIAQAMQRWGLHRRVALLVIRFNPDRPVVLVGSFMLASALLSLWVSNTATALMIVPIGMSVVELVHPDRGARGGHSNFAICLMLAVAYGASIGGMGTIIGTPTNAVLVGFLSESYGLEIGFVQWMALALPVVVVGLPVVLVVLTRFVYPVELKALPGGRAFVEGELAKLGPMSRGERVVGTVLSLTALAWMTSPAISRWLPGISDTGIALLGALALFLIPVGEGQRALDWPNAARLPWDILLLFGGGLSLAAAINDTGLAEWIGRGTQGFSDWPPLLVVLVVVVTITFLTELTSNTATAAAFLPILASVAVGIGQNPLLLVVPATLAASCAFMLPVATPPNAIVYGSSFLTTQQMARAGLALNLLLTLIVSALCFLMLPLTMDVAVGQVPDWARAR